MSRKNSEIFTNIRKLIPGILVFAALTTTSCNAQDKEAPPWGEFLRQGRWPGVDKLLRTPFRMSPETEVKGLAAKLRARELDIPNRIKAVKYLSTFHCAQFPEARDMLVSVILTDKWEPVRYEAAVALRDMFSNCACGADQTVSKKDRTRGAPDEGSPKHCACCCDADTLNQLAKVAYEIKDNGCCFEPSRRVREMAVEAIRACGIPCHFEPYRVSEEQGPPAWQEVEGDQKEQKEDSGDGGGEFVPPPSKELLPVPSDQESVKLPSMTSAEPISRLSKICLVSLKHGEKAQASPEFSSIYRGRLYNFSSIETKSEFDRNPELNAVAFGGCDPVHFVENREVLEGRFLVLHEGKFYMFATPENYEVFKSNVGKYTGRHTAGSELALASPSP